MDVCRIVFSQHAFIRMFERGISPAAVKRGMRTGESIESYPDDQPFPSVLLLHFEEGRALHIVAGVDETESTCYTARGHKSRFCQLPTDCSAKRKNGCVPSESVFAERFANPLEEITQFMPVGSIHCHGLLARARPVERGL